jgi:Domain of unknown function (DUF4440)
MKQIFNRVHLYGFYTLTATLLVWCAMVLVASDATGQNSASDLTGPKLVEVGIDLDAKLFRAYNDCDLETFAALLAPNIDAYHDFGGHVVGRDTLKGLVQKNICSGPRIRRELVAGSMETLPIRGFGAVQTSESLFWRRQPDGTEVKGQTARDVKLWEQRDGVWLLAMWISYDHKPATAK